jgi:hypothetical protein
MSTPITCPTCKTKFNLEEVLTEDVEKSIKEKYENQNKELVAQLKLKEEAFAIEQKKFEENKKKENDLFKERLDKATALAQQTMEIEIRKKMEDEQKAKMDFYAKQQAENEEKLKSLQNKELEVLKLNKLLKDQEAATVHLLDKQKFELEIQLRDKITEDLQKTAEQKYEFKLKELEQKLSQQTKLIDEQKRKMEQGSMEQQGEIQENMVKEKLTSLFPFDEITDVAKGKKGADIIQTIRNSNGVVCGQIIYESKNTKNWSNEWAEKLQGDVREQKADMGVLISQVLPKHIKNIGKEKSIWICSYAEFEGVAAMLREAVIAVFESKQSQENKGDKMIQLYDYLNGNDFKQKWEAILIGFGNMKKSIDRQRIFYNNTLAEQEQIANSIIINANNFLGSIKGISGSSMDEMRMLE